MDEKLPTAGIDQNDNESLDPKGESRRRLMVLSLLTAGALLIPNEAESNSTLIESPQAHNGYPGLINNFRRQFGTRQDYQEGFVQATQNTNSITELPGGVFGLLEKDPTNNNIIPSSIYPVDEAGFLHATHSIKDPLNYARKTNEIWGRAGGALMKQIRDTILVKYPEYNLERGGFSNRPWLLDAISKPVVSLKNLQDEQLEMFLRIPKPGTEEYHRLATKDWDDYKDQGKLRHKHPFHSKYNPSQSLYQNLNNFYGPQMQTLRNASQAVKNHVAVSIRRVDQAFNNQLTASQKTALNDWLNVTGTQYAI